LIKYTIIVPTRNTAKDLVFTVKSILANKYENFELIVSFNNMKVNNIKFLNKIKDKRLKIFFTPANFSMVKHYEWVLKKAKGEWVSIIGDDDAIVSNFFETIDEKMKIFYDKKIQAISINSSNYYYEGVQSVYGPTVFRYYNHDSTMIRDSRTNLIRVMLGLMPYQRLPGIYVSGVIKKDLIDKITKLSNNKFFHEPNPDVYSAIIISLFIKNYLRIEKPLFLVGTSKKSNAYKLIHELDKKRGRDPGNNIFISDSERDGYLISEKVPKFFWHSRLISAFLFSALFNAQKIIYKNNLISYFFFIIRVAFDLIDDKNFINKMNREKSKKIFLGLLKNSFFLSNLVYFFSYFYFLFLKLMHYIEKNKIKVIIKLLYFQFIINIKFIKIIYLYSKNRKQYPNIYVASQFVL
jgi:glycosyltransferase involved in cell wall biosynthesis